MDGEDLGTNAVDVQPIARDDHEEEVSNPLASSIAGDDLVELPVERVASYEGEFAENNSHTPPLAGESGVEDQEPGIVTGVESPPEDEPGPPTIPEPADPGPGPGPEPSTPVTVHTEDVVTAPYPTQDTIQIQPVGTEQDVALLDEYNRYLYRRYSKSTYNNCRSIMKNFLEYLGDAPINEQTTRGFLSSEWYINSTPAMQRQANVVMRSLIGMSQGSLSQLDPAPSEPDELPPFMGASTDSDSVTSRAKSKTKKAKKSRTRSTKETEKNMSSRNGVPVDVLIGGPENDHGGPAGVRVTHVGGSVSASADPSVSELRKATGAEEPRLIIYAVDELGNQHEAARATSSEMKYAGGAVQYVKKFLTSLYPNAFEFRVCIKDRKGTETLQTKVELPKPKPPQDPIESARRAFEEERKATRNEEIRRQEMEDKRFDRMLGTLSSVLGKDSGGGGGGSMTRDMIAMQMAREIMRDSSVRGPDYESALLKKLDDLGKAQEKRVQSGGKELSPMEQLMYMRATKQMMDEMFPPQPQLPALPPMGGPSSFGSGHGYPSFDLPGSSMLPPLSLPNPPHSSADDLEKITNTLSRFMPTPQQQMGPSEVIGLMRQFNEMQGGGSNNLVITMLQNELQHTRNELAQIRNKPESSLADQMQSMAMAMGTMMNLANQLGGGNRGEMSTLEFINEIAGKVPDIIDSAVSAKVKAEMSSRSTSLSDDDELGGEDAESEEWDEETMDSPMPNASNQQQQRSAKAFQKFDKDLRAATTEEAYGNALIGFVTGLKGDPRWDKMFRTIAILGVQGNGAAIFKIISNVLNAMYDDHPPKGSAKALTKIILKYNTMIASHMGVDAEKVRKQIREQKAKAEAAKNAQSQPKPKPTVSSEPKVRATTEQEQESMIEREEREQRERDRIKAAKTESQPVEEREEREENLPDDDYMEVEGEVLSGEAIDDEDMIDGFVDDSAPASMSAGVGVK